MQAYLFVHFREKTTPEGEQVYFGLSRDGFLWEPVNDGRPVLWSYFGEKGVRDCTVIRGKDGIFRIFATDLSLAYRFRQFGELNWPVISKTGSKCFAMWESEDLVNWSRQVMVPLGGEDFGCLWAPDVVYDPKAGEYVLHWSSTHVSNEFGHMGIYCARTQDFRTFTPPKLLYRKENAGVIDSAIYEENGEFYMFLKSDHDPERIILLRAPDVEGPYTRVPEFDRCMEAVEAGLYEGPTAARLEDGRWCLFLDYYGVPGPGQGYVPFLADSLESGKFVRADAHFAFPYGYKHGTVIPITMDEYDRIKRHRWSDTEWK